MPTTIIDPANRHHTGEKTLLASKFRILDDTDNTKVVKVAASGLTTNTTRTLTVQDGTGTLAHTGLSKTVLFNGVGKVGASAGWAVGAGADTCYLATMAASQTAGTFVVHLPGLRVGDVITGFYPIGQIESAGNAATLDADLRYHDNTAADPGDTSIGTITQISVTADTSVGVAHIKSGLSHTVAATNSYYVLLTGTTAASTDIIAISVAVVVTDNSGTV